MQMAGTWFSPYLSWRASPLRRRSPVFCLPPLSRIPGLFRFARWKDMCELWVWGSPSLLNDPPTLKWGHSGGESTQRPTERFNTLTEETDSFFSFLRRPLKLSKAVKTPAPPTNRTLLAWNDRWVRSLQSLNCKGCWAFCYCYSIISIPL